MRLTRVLLAEFIGTYFLCSTIALAAGQAQLLAPLAIGAVLMAMVFAFGHVSGAHFNPAVTLAVLLRGGNKISVGDAAMYWVAQLCGAFAAAGVQQAGLGLPCMNPKDTAGMAHDAAVMASCGSGYPMRNPKYSVGFAVITELTYTFALASVVLHVATTKAQDGNSFFGLAIGFTVCAAAVAAGGVSGGAFNPAVGTALPAVHGHAKDIWIYWVGPLVGAALAGLVFRVTNDEDDDE